MICALVIPSWCVLRQSCLREYLPYSTISHRLILLSIPHVNKYCELLYDTIAVIRLSWFPSVFGSSYSDFVVWSKYEIVNFPSASPQIIMNEDSLVPLYT